MAGRGRGGSSFYLSIGGDRKLFPALLCRDFQGRRCSRCADNIAFYFIFCIFLYFFLHGIPLWPPPGFPARFAAAPWRAPSPNCSVGNSQGVVVLLFCFFNGNAAIGYVTSCVCFCSADLDRNTREQALVGSHKQSKHGIMES